MLAEKLNELGMLLGFCGFFASVIYFLINLPQKLNATDIYYALAYLTVICFGIFLVLAFPKHERKIDVQPE
jgi:hypothetical protein